MSGHSKWSQIKRQKGIADQKKGTAFTKLGNAITVAVREGGKDPSMNVRLRLAIEKARTANMPKDNMERAVMRGTGDLGRGAIESVTYEGYGPGGGALVVETLTDNRNRTTSELRNVLSEHGGSLANANSVLWMFERRGFLEVKSNGNRDSLELAAIDAGALDTEEENGSLGVYTEPTALPKVQEALSQHGAKVLNAEIALIPKTTVTPNAEDRTRLHKLLLGLEELPDVTNVATNAEI